VQQAAEFVALQTSGSVLQQAPWAQAAIGWQATGTQVPATLHWAFVVHAEPTSPALQVSVFKSQKPVRSHWEFVVHDCPTSPVEQVLPKAGQEAPAPAHCATLVQGVPGGAVPPTHTRHLAVFGSQVPGEQNASLVQRPAGPPPTQIRQAPPLFAPPLHPAQSWLSPR